MDARVASLEAGKRAAEFHLAHARKHRCGEAYWEKLVAHYEAELAKLAETKPSPRAGKAVR